MHIMYYPPDSDSMSENHLESMHLWHLPFCIPDWFQLSCIFTIPVKSSYVSNPPVHDIVSWLCAIKVISINILLEPLNWMFAVQHREMVVQSVLNTICVLCFRNSTARKMRGWLIQNPCSAKTTTTMTLRWWEEACNRTYYGSMVDEGNPALIIPTFVPTTTTTVIIRQ